MDSLVPYNPFENRKSGAKYTQEQVDYIKQLVDQGWSASKIAKEYNLSCDSIRKRIKDNNWSATQNQRQKKLTQAELDEIKEKIDNNVPIAEISKEYDISKDALWRRKANNSWTVKKRKNKYNFDESYFDIIDTEHKAYWLGFLMADGYILSKRKGKRANQSQSFGFTISVKDIELFDYFKEDLKADNPVNIYKNSSSSSFKTDTDFGRILLASQRTVDALKSHGIVENKTFITKMPELQQELVPHFIRGYSDGDGSISIDINNRIGWSLCGTKELLNSIQDFFGLNYKLSQRFPERNNNNWQLHVSGWQNVPMCLDIIYKDASVYLKRKYDKYAEMQGKIRAMDVHLHQ